MPREPGRACPQAADVRWSIVGQSAVKPRNDSFADAGARRWRANEDRFHLRQGADGAAAAVADGAGSSGLFCGAWAEALVTRLPDLPIVDLPGLDAWLAGFALDFREDYASLVAADPAKRAKFIREGSCATLAACWLGRGVDDGPLLHWLAYGDSPVLVFDRGTSPPRLLACHPERLSAFDRDPHLLNWRDVPVAAGLKAGRIVLPAAASVILASDAIGQFLLLRHFAAGAGGRDAMAEEFGRLGATGGRLSAAARAHLAHQQDLPDSDILDDLRRHLGGPAAFAAMVRRFAEDGLLANDDATVVMIDVEIVPPVEEAPAEEDDAGGGDDLECHCRLTENPGS